MLCPACKRIADNYPAGFVTLGGSFFEEHREEILNMLKNLEKMESSEHPLERMMEIREEDGQTIITTTGIHLARRLANGLKDSHEGELDISYDAENFVRVSWER